MMDGANELKKSTRLKKSIGKDAVVESGAVSRSEKMGGLVKGLAIMEMFGAGYAQLTIADAARGSDTTRASARRCLLTLTELGYLEYDGKFYRPKARLRRLGGQAVDGSLGDYARPVLEDVCERLRESVSLAILDGRESLFVARAVASRVVSTGVRVGGRLPAYCSATGRLLLSTLDDDEIRAYLRSTALEQRTMRTLTDPEEILKQVVKIRVTGVSLSDEELELGMRSMAVPVRSRNNQIVAAMSLSTSSARVAVLTMITDYLPVLQAAAGTLHQILLKTGT
jgi:IclR family pca regulon transcriptional regulator